MEEAIRARLKEACERARAALRDGSSHREAVLPGTEIEVIVSVDGGVPNDRERRVDLPGGPVPGYSILTVDLPGKGSSIAVGEKADGWPDYATTEEEIRDLLEKAPSAIADMVRDILDGLVDAGAGPEELAREIEQSAVRTVMRA